MMASTQSTIFNKPHECGSGCEACRLLIAKIEVLRARAAENDLLRARIAELENAGAADDEPMQIADSDDDVKILEVFAPATAAVSNAAAAKKKYQCDQCSQSYEHASDFQYHLSTHKTAPISKSFKCNWPGCTNKTGFVSAKTLNAHTRLYHKGEAKKSECPVCGKMITSNNLGMHMKIHTGQNKVSCTLCAISFSRASNLAAHNKKFAYEHLCMENGNKFSCALDERLAGSSDENAEEQQYDNMRSLFSHHADRHSSVYVLLESLPGAATNRVFSAFISQIFYVGSTTALHTRGKTHASLPESPAKIQKMRQIWSAGGVVNMIELGSMAREEAMIAEGAVIDALGIRNLVNEKRGLSYAEGTNFAVDRRSFAQLGTHILSLLHTGTLNGKARILKSHE